MVSVVNDINRQLDFNLYEVRTTTEVPFTSTTALTNATNPYVQKLANQGILNALKSDEYLLKGLNIYQGQITHPGVSDAFNLKFTSPGKAIA
jgi:alanine dehydrogenase